MEGGTRPKPANRIMRSRATAENTPTSTQMGCHVLGPRRLPAVAVACLGAMMFTTVATYGNALLEALSARDLESLAPYLERVQLLDQQLLHVPDIAHHHVYFPVDCIVSLQALLSDGASSEIAMVGRDGAAGVALIMGSDRVAWRVCVHGAGSAWRIGASDLYRECLRSSQLQLALLRYSQTLMQQIAQIAVCNRHHTVGQQLCRWLLMMLDRLPSNELCITHERIANLLGVRREGVTEVACNLQRMGIIRYRRGHIELLKRPELEIAACECYRIHRGCGGLAAAGASARAWHDAAVRPRPRQLPAPAHAGGWSTALGA